MICKRGFRMTNYSTKPREYILKFLSEHKNKRFSCKDMYEHIKNEGYDINLATIYRNVDKLVESGELLKHQSNDSNCATYQYIENTNCLAHFHFECKKCGRMVHLGTIETNNFLKMIQNKLFFTVEPQNTYITGLCNDCNRKFISIGV